MYCIKQATCHHCFPACLVSFFSDLRIQITQNEIVNRCPKEFNKDNKTIGAISSNDLIKENIVSNEFGIRIQIVPPYNIKLNKNESLFLFVRWLNNPSDNHCIRYCHKTSRYIYFMNPTHGKIEHIDLNTLLSWITIPILITKT